MIPKLAFPLVVRVQEPASKTKQLLFHSNYLSDLHVNKKITARSTAIHVARMSGKRKKNSVLA
jgi:hypothetical protein